LKGCYEDLGGLGVQNEEEREKTGKKKFIGAILEVYWPHTLLRDGEPPR